MASLRLTEGSKWPRKGKEGEAGKMQRVKFKEKNLTWFRQEINYQKWKLRCPSFLILIFIKYSIDLKYCFLYTDLQSK